MLKQSPSFNGEANTRHKKRQLLKGIRKNSLRCLYLHSSADIVILEYHPIQSVLNTAFTTRE